MSYNEDQWMRWNVCLYTIGLRPSYVAKWARGEAAWSLVRREVLSGIDCERGEGRGVNKPRSQLPLNLQVLYMERTIIKQALIAASSELL